jgi:hypothetical protein
MTDSCPHLVKILDMKDSCPIHVKILEGEGYSSLVILFDLTGQPGPAWQPWFLPLCKK